MSGRVITNISFDDWVAYTFDHPVSYPKPEWYWDSDADELNLDASTVLEHTARLFNNSGELLRQFSDSQVNQGLWFLIGAPTDLYILSRDSVPLEQRLSCVKAIYQIYKQCFATRCTDHLSHLDEPGVGDLNSACYMWWELFPYSGSPENSSNRPLDEACLEAMENALQLPSIAVQESAIHGLSHWGMEYPDECAQILNRFAESNVKMRPELSRYVSAALNQAVE